MNVQAILRQAEELGISIRAVGDRIRYRPKAAASAEFVEALRQHKGEMLTHLAGTEVTQAAYHLLAWATELTERDVVLSAPVTYVEAPLRHVTTSSVSWYARHYLQVIIDARFHQEKPKYCWGLWTPRWWKEREEEALGALKALREAMQDDAKEHQR